MNNPKPAVLISTSRSGSTFLLHALDSHYQIGCERSEPLAPGSPWLEIIGNDRRRDTMRLLWQRPGYQVSMFKLSYRQARWAGFDILTENDVKIIHLHRENVVRTIVSSMINTAVNEGRLNYPNHTMKRIEPAKIVLDPDNFVSECYRYCDNVQTMKRDLENLGLSILWLTYGQVVGGEGREASQVDIVAAEKICAFLEVQSLPLFSELRKLNAALLSKIVENWNEVQEAALSSGLGAYLE